MRIENNFEIAGEFWLPGFKQNKLYGRLSVQDGGKITLDLMQLFQNTNHLDNITRVVGIVGKGIPIILDNGVYIKYSHPMFNIVKSETTIWFKQLYKGISYTGKNEIKFSELHFSYENISSWHFKNFFSFDLKDIQNSYKITKEHAISFQYRFKNEIELEITPRVPFESKNKQLTIAGKLDFRLYSSKKILLHDFFQTIKVISLFINFCTRRPNNLVNVTSPVDNSQDDKIQIYYRSLFFNQHIPEDHLDFPFLNYEHLINYNIFKNWERLYTTTHPSIQLYLTASFARHELLESKYLPLTQALEIFHRGLNNDFNMSNERTDFIKRLKELIKPIRAYFGSRDKIDSFLTYILNTRDEITHTGRVKKDKQSIRYNLLELINILEIWLPILIMYHLEIPENEIKKRLDWCSIELPLLK